MKLLNILEYPDLRLKRKAKKVTDFGKVFQDVVDHMFATHYAAKNCAALAATQLDLIDPPHVTVIDFSPKHDQPLCLVNGEVVEREGEQNEEEGCMSVGCNIGIPVHAYVKRAYKIRVKAQDRFGAPLDFWVEEYMAKCIQHELDHLEGKIYLDHLSSIKRERLEKKLAKEKKQKVRDDNF